MQIVRLAAGVFLATWAAHQPTPAVPLADPPLSTGSVAMLVPHAAAPVIQERLAQAIDHDDADVRAVAARVVLVTASRGLVPALRDRIARESDAIAATEQMRALATLSTAADDRVLVDLALRHGRQTVVALAEVLARVRPGSLVAYAGQLGAAAQPGALSSALVLASIREPAIASAVTEAALNAGARTWGSFLAGRHDRNLPVDGPILSRSLQSSDSETRLAALRHTAMVVGFPEDTTDPEVVAAVVAVADTDLRLDSWESALRELIRRSKGKPHRRVDWGTLFEGAPLTWQFPPDLNARLLGRERGLVEKRLGRRLPDDDELATSASRIRPESWKEVTRLAPIFAGGLLADVMRLTGCQPDERAMAAADIRHRADGRPQQVALADVPLSPSCRMAASTVFTLTVAPVLFDGTAGSRDGVLLPLSNAFVKCTTPRPEVPPDPWTLGKAIEPPLALEMPATGFPERYRKERISGTVNLSMVLTSEGCIREASTTRSMHPAFDLEAIRKVLGARWQAMRADGQPMPASVVMEVAFNSRN
jgi:TonB family protein